MKCPIDNTDLQMSERSGIEIDYCPTCRGVWLDRGELDKIIEKNDAPRPQAAAPLHHAQPHHQDGYHHKKHRKEGFLGDLFDF
jgi:uncharacterized protein